MLIFHSLSKSAVPDEEHWSIHWFFFLLVCFLVKRMVDTFINVLNCAAYEFTFLT